MTAEVLQTISALKNQGRDFILATHEMGFARKVADQVAFVADGRLVEAGPPEQIFEHPTSPVTRAFLARVLQY
jgi:polar amino acid transport system ATP-binding protein